MLTDDTEIAVSTPPKETIKPIGPGSRLRKIREARHLSIEEMAKRLRLSRERLVQIESDDYLLMGAPAFAKGYLRAYSSQLGVAKEEILTILQAFDELNLGADIQHNKPELIHEKIDQVSPKTTRWISYLMLLLLLGCLGYWWYSHVNNLNKTLAIDKTTTTVETPVSLPNVSNAAVTSAIQKSEPAALPVQTSPLDAKASPVYTLPSTSSKSNSSAAAKAKPAQLEE